jgi:hypothetical protein
VLCHPAGSSALLSSQRVVSSRRVISSAVINRRLSSQRVVSSRRVISSAVITTLLCHPAGSSAPLSSQLCCVIAKRISTKLKNVS